MEYGGTSSFAYKNPLSFFFSFSSFLYFIFFNFINNIMGKDYYSILGISRDADDDTLKKAYRKLGKV